MDLSAHQPTALQFMPVKLIIMCDRKTVNVHNTLSAIQLVQWYMLQDKVHCQKSICGLTKAGDQEYIGHWWEQEVSTKGHFGKVKKIKIIFVWWGCQKFHLGNFQPIFERFLGDMGASKGWFVSLVPSYFSTKKKINNQPIRAAVPVYPVTKKGRDWLLGVFFFVLKLVKIGEKNHPV